MLFGYLLSCPSSMITPEVFGKQAQWHSTQWYQLRP
ncbi:unnamed protein product [Rhodiola kirilowii]